MGLPSLLSLRTHNEPIAGGNPPSFRWYQYFASVDALLRALFGTIPNVQTASYQLAGSDNGGVVEMDVAGANNLTVPNNNTVPLVIGHRTQVTQLGAGTTTVVAGAGVTIRSRLGLVSSGQYAVFALYQRAANDWVLSGDLT